MRSRERPVALKSAARDSTATARNPTRNRARRQPMEFYGIPVRLRHPVILHFFLMCVFAAPAVAGQGGQAAIRALTTGAAIYHAGCAGCHGERGEGAPDTTTVFDRPDTFPDFSDC